MNRLVIRAGAGRAEYWTIPERLRFLTPQLKINPVRGEKKKKTAGRETK